jgi:hypothetical protein
MIRNAYVWAMCVVQYVGAKVDKENYSTNMARLDNRMKHFMISYPVRPCDFFRFTKGVSHMFTNAKKQIGALAENNLSAGKVEAQKFPALVFMLSICIGTDDVILPNSSRWSRIYLPSRYQHMNVLDVVQKALSSAAELCFAMRCRDPTEAYLANLQQVFISPYFYTCSHYFNNICPYFKSCGHYFNNIFSYFNHYSNYFNLF